MHQLRLDVAAFEEHVAYRRMLPEAPDDVIEWLATLYRTLREELGYKAIPHDVLRDLLPILAALGFRWPNIDAMKIEPRLKRRRMG